MVLTCGMWFEHVQQPHHSTIALIGFMKKNIGSGFLSNGIQTIPGIEFSFGNWIMLSISINTILVVCITGALSVLIHILDQITLEHTGIVLVLHINS